jgi:hypothetical protein
MKKNERYKEEENLRITGKKGDVDLTKLLNKI